MKYLIKNLSVLILGLSAPHIHAVTVQKCIDGNNESTYQYKCPPGTTSANSLELQAGKASSKSVDPVLANTKITLYAVPNCEACDITRQTLEKYSANFTEVDIQGKPELQKKLKDIIGGAGKVTVPVVILGEKQIVGYNKTMLISELEAAGFEDESKEEEAQQAEDETDEEET